MAANVFELPFEIGIIEWLQTFLPGWLIEGLSFMSIIGETLPLIAILGFLYWSYRKEFGKRVGDTMVTANVLFPLIKNGNYPVSKSFPALALVGIGIMGLHRQNSI